MHSKNLISAKVLFFTTAMCGVGWSRFQNNFYLDNGLSSTEIGTLKSVGLLLKIAGTLVSTSAFHYIITRFMQYLYVSNLITSDYCSVRFMRR